VHLRDWWRIILRELPAGLVLGTLLGIIAIARIALWNATGLYDYGQFSWLIAVTVGVTLLAVVTIGSLSGSMLPFLLKRLGFDPASASAPFVATIVDVSAISLYFSIAYIFLGGKLL
jgi:magnesium transporter